MSDSLHLRAMEPRDYDFVIDTWMKSFKTSWYAGPIPANMFSRVYQRVLEDIIGTQGYLCSAGCGYVAESRPKFHREHVEPGKSRVEGHHMGDPVPFVTPSRDGVEVIVACDPPDDPSSEILGYLVRETGRQLPVIHFCYVRGGKEGMRRLGIARMLMYRAGVRADTEFAYTFKTRTGDCWLRHAYPRSRFNPRFAIYDTDKENSEWTRKTATT